MYIAMFLPCSGPLIMQSVCPSIRPGFKLYNAKPKKVTVVGRNSHRDTRQTVVKFWGQKCKSQRSRGHL